jgi:hypothetical protein
MPFVGVAAAIWNDVTPPTNVNAVILGKRNIWQVVNSSRGRNIRPVFFDLGCAGQQRQRGCLKVEQFMSAR